MGSYSHISFDKYPIFTAKNSYRTDAVDSIFLPEDYISEVRPNNSRNKLAWVVDKEDDSEYTFKGYRQTAKICKQRLEIFGTKLSTAKKDFETARVNASEEGYYDFLISKVTYKKYLDELRNIIKDKEKSWDYIYKNFKESLIYDELSIYGQSVESVLYSILSIIPEDSIIECDLSEVIGNGWVEEPGIRDDDDIEKIIVLAEGKTDTEFISKALSILYPHLCRYYHFIDFDEFKVESNASALAKLVIALTASNVKHPFIVLFDNDTTGIFEMKRLMQIKLPENIKVLKFPDIKLAKSYPTVGPTGIKKMNINGLACGIEMYFGHDVLMKNNTVIPVHWKAYNDKEKQYQGEITEKNYVQEKFREKLKSGNGDFTDIKTLLNMIFNAFN
ncbi:HEPN/Toprim-associated domain-containing protein [Flavobacterium sp. 2]|uniref:HEPN/Toprim-associated domain-containing protein n=1 Tax=Flavobacterium sp. 2 TaxID=308053 RepID=UPI003CEB1AC0